MRRSRGGGGGSRSSSSNGGGGEDNPTVVAVDSVSLSPNVLALEVEEQKALTATVLPENASNKTVSWASDHPEIATVDGGTVTGVATGSAVITASAGDKSDTCRVTVSPKTVAVSSVSVAPAELGLEVGDEGNLTVTVLPADATNKAVTFQSNSAAVSVDENGHYIARAIGNAVITVTSVADASKSASVPVTVVEHVIPVESIILSRSTLTLKDGGREEDGQWQLQATLLPANSTVRTPTWESLNEEVATVEDGLVVSTGVGETDIKAYVGEGSARVEVACHVTVERLPVSKIEVLEDGEDGEPVAVTKVDLDVTDKYAIVPTITPAQATNDAVTFTSSEPTVASVDEDGNVKALKLGSTTITIASESDPTVTCELPINVGLKVNRSYIAVAMGEGQYFQLTANSGMDGTATWTSANPAIAAVDVNGKVTPVAGGQTTITVTKDGASKEIGVNVLGAVNYTYNDYTTVSPSNWNELTYQDNNDTQILGYISGGLFTFNYKFDEGHYGEADHIVDGDFSVEYDGAQALEDITTQYAGNENYAVPEGATSGYAYKITLRDDLKMYVPSTDTVTEIHAADFVNTMKEQLNPEFQNYRADSYYLGETVIHNAKDYVKQGQSGYFGATETYDAYDEALDGNLIFAVSEPYKKTTSLIYSYLATDLGYESYIKSRGIAWLMEALFGSAPCTQAELDSLQGKTVAQIKANPALKAIFDDVIEWWDEGEDGILHCCIANYVFPAVNWDSVGIKVGANPNELILILDKSLELLEDNHLSFHAAYELSSLPLVQETLYNSCKRDPQIGATLKTSVYNSSYETSASWGPYYLSYFQAGKQYILEKNPHWYGWNMDSYAGQYKTDRIICDTIPSWNTAWLSFQQGDIASIGMDVSIADEYKGSSRALFTASDFIQSMQVQSDAEALKKRESDGVDKEMLLYADFRQAMSLAVNRAEFAAATTTASKAGFGLFNSMHYYDVEHGGVYRNEDVAKKVICEVYGVNVEDYATLDEAYAAVTGYNLTLAKQLVTKAYTEAKAAGTITDNDNVVITFGTAEDTESTRRVFNKLTEYLTAMVVGTPLEGRLKTEFKTFGTKWANDFRAGAYDVCTGGWSGAAWNPGYFLLAYLDSNYRYARGWDPTSVKVTYNPYGDDQDEHEYTMNLMEWYGCLNGKSDAKFNWSDGKVPHAFRLGIIAQLEKAILKTYFVIPMVNGYSAQLDSYKLNRFSRDYNTFMGYGGIRYLGYAYTDAEWATRKNTYDYRD